MKYKFNYSGDIFIIDYNKLENFKAVFIKVQSQIYIISFCKCLSQKKKKMFKSLIN